MSLLTKKNDLMKELHDSDDYKNLNFKYVDPKNNDVSFYGYRNSKKLFSIIKNNQIKFDDVLKKQNEFLNKLSNIKISKKTSEQKEVINNLEKFYKSGEEVINSFKDYGKLFLMQPTNQKKIKLREKALKY